MYEYVKGKGWVNAGDAADRGEAIRQFLDALRKDVDLRKDWLACLESKIVEGKSLDDIKGDWERIVDVLVKELL